MRVSVGVWVCMHVWVGVVVVGGIWEVWGEGAESKTNSPKSRSYFTAVSGRFVVCLIVLVLFVVV